MHEGSLSGASFFGVQLSTGSLHDPSNIGSLPEIKGSRRSCPSYPLPWKGVFYCPGGAQEGVAQEGVAQAGGAGPRMLVMEGPSGKWRGEIQMVLSGLWDHSGFIPFFTRESIF